MTWELYDRLIEQVPSDIKIDWVHMGKTWTVVHAGPYCGLAVTINEQDLVLPSWKKLIGTDLQSAAELCYTASVRQKKAAIIGHFYNLEKFLTGAASISVLERKPWPGDYPDSACEYLLPQQDFVFITGSAFVNKTLPRLLQLSSAARAIVLGPSTPMSPTLFDYGADELSGLAPDILTPEQAELVSEGNIKMSSYGTRVRLRREDFSRR